MMRAHDTTQNQVESEIRSLACAPSSIRYLSSELADVQQAMWNQDTKLGGFRCELFAAGVKKKEIQFKRIHSNK